MESPTSVKFIGQYPPGIDWSQRNDTGLHCRNSSAVVMMQKIVVVTMTLHRRAMCHRRKTMRNRNKATEALDTAIPI